MFFKKSQSLDENWQADVVEKLLFASLKEQRSARRWRIFFRFVFLFYFTVLLLQVMQPTLPTMVSSKPHVALIQVNGLISSATKANAESIVDSLKMAFDDDKVKGIILHINSPGGSAVQSDEIYTAIRQLRQQNPNKKVYAVISDMGASGAYYIASAADGIYANQSSLVGSIGVLFNGFGFVDAMQKIGVQRRVYTAGVNKSKLDPFSPEKPEDIEYIHELLADVHKTFIEKVKAGRGNRLVSEKDHPDLFSGLAWSGAQAKELGLIDGFGTVDDIAIKFMGTDEIVDYSQSDSLLEKFGVTNFIADQIQSYSHLNSPFMAVIN